MAERDLHKEFDVLKKDLGKLQEDLKRLTETGGSVASDAVAAAKAKLEAETEQLVQRLREVGGEARHRSKQVLEDVEHKVEEQPLTALATSFGIGLVLGWLLSRK